MEVSEKYVIQSKQQCRFPCPWRCASKIHRGFEYMVCQGIQNFPRSLSPGCFAVPNNKKTYRASRIPLVLRERICWHFGTECILRFSAFRSSSAVLSSSALEKRYLSLRRGWRESVGDGFDFVLRDLNITKVFWLKISYQFMHIWE